MGFLAIVVTCFIIVFPILGLIGFFSALKAHRCLRDLNKRIDDLQRMILFYQGNNNNNNKNNNSNNMNNITF